MRTPCYEMLRKQGFLETLEILNSYPNHETSLSGFFKDLRNQWDSYPNRYFRVQPFLIQAKLITYRLDNNFQKIICLTQKGESFLKLIDDLDHQLEFY